MILIISNKLYSYSTFSKSWFCALTKQAEAGKDDEERVEHEELKQDGRTENMKTPKVVNRIRLYK